MRLVGRILVSLLVVVLVMTLAGAGFFWWSVRRSFPQTNGSLAISGLQGSVQVIRNERGIPDIYADTPQDLFTALGYVVAQDRFWQMDFNRHVTAGRLSEMFGQSTVDQDAFLRTMGWHDVAAKEYQMLEPSTRTVLTSYAQGINAYLEGKSPAEISFEYTPLGLQNPDYQIEKWDPVDSVAWLKAMAFDLIGNYDDEMARVTTAAKVGVRRSEELYPPYPYGRNGTIISDAENRNLARSEQATAEATAAAVVQSKSARDAFERTAKAQERAATLIGSRGDGLGSDSWVVSGDLTSSGKPLLANDMHLGPQMPSIWYQAGLHCRTVSPQCPYDVAGFILPNIPGVIVGHNNDIAWGFTNLGPDVSDLVLEEVQGNHYIVDGRRVPITTRTETITVAGGDPITLKVRSTEAGPIVSDVYGSSSDEFKTVGKQAPVPAPGQTAVIPPARRDGEYAVSLKWTALTPRPTMDAVPMLNTARNFGQFRSAARMFTVPAQNMIYADTRGTIGYQTPGAIPRRQGYDGRWPVPGWDSRLRWTGVIPFPKLPTITDPPAGWITTANQYVVPGNSPQADVQTDFYAYGARAKRINIRLAEIVNAGQKIGIADMQSTQMDAGNDLAAWLVPKLQQFQPGSTADQAVQLFNGWDFQQPSTSAAAMYFNAFYSQLVQRMFTDELGAGKAVSFNAGDQIWEVIRVLWREPNNAWWDDVATAQKEDRDQTVTASLQAAADQLSTDQGPDPSSWSWGRQHTLTVANPSLGASGIAPIERILNRGPIETGGGGSIPLATNWVPAEGYEVTAVPSMRQVVDMSDLDNSTWVNLTGNSGHTYNPHYVDQLDAWNAGTQFPWPFTAATVQQQGQDILTLEPN